MNDLLDIDHMHKCYRGRMLFEIGPWSLDAGSVYLVAGANGAGKSTLLRILAGLERADGSALRFMGRLTRLVPYPEEMRQAIVFVHQHPILFSTSVAHNIAYGLLARGTSRTEVARQVDDAMAWAGVSHLRACNPAHLPGAEKQRVALARAKVLRPRLLLLDEPLASLENDERAQVIAMIPELTEAGGSVVMACHDGDQVGLPCMHMLKLHDGRLVEC